MRIFKGSSSSPSAETLTGLKISIKKSPMNKLEVLSAGERRSAASSTESFVNKNDGAREKSKERLKLLVFHVNRPSKTLRRGA